MIPDLVEGVLPEGLHSCTWEECEQRFGRFTRTDRRQRLTTALWKYIQDARASRIAVAVVVDGSYVTTKAEPNDIDLILVLRRDFDLAAELRPTEYNIQSKRAVRKLFGFDVLPAIDRSDAYEEYLGLFSRVRLDDPEQQTNRTVKGLLRIEL